MDQRILLWINHDWHTPVLDWIMALASSWAFWFVPAITALLAVAFFGRFHARAMLFCAVCALGFNDGVVAHTLKNLVERPRPNAVVPGLRMLDLANARPRLLALTKPLKIEFSQPGILPERGKSFPSGHTSNNFCLATIVAVFYRRWGWLMFLPASIVSISRIYVAAHWPSDVAISIFVGMACAFFTLGLLEWSWRRWGARLVPALAAKHPSLIQK